MGTTSELGANYNSQSSGMIKFEPLPAIVLAFLCRLTFLPFVDKSKWLRDTKLYL